MVSSFPLRIIFSKCILYFNTIKYLKFRQIFYRIYYKLYTKKVRFFVKHINIRKINSCSTPCFLPKHHLYFISTIALFLNHPVAITNAVPWNDMSQEKLWLYNLHYFDALHAIDHNQQDIAYQLLNKWIDENPPCVGIGWEPFPLSLRIVNIIKYALSGKQLSEKIIYSLYLQARTLNKKCEFHVLGNHLFENFKALCLAGLFFDTVESKKWFQKGYGGLQKEIKEQILNDGGHFELSPMYHGIILEGLLDLENIFKLYKKAFLWKNTIEKMLHWLDYMKRSDDEIAYFNDAANALYATPNELFLYAEKMGYKRKSLAPCGYLLHSGYIVLNRERIKIICDVGNIGPDYLPGHGHADVLSFELYIDGFPVFINLGTSCYGNSERRLFERATIAHNTVSVNQKNSSEVWSVFRVARRARVKNITVVENNDHTIIQAEHNGYKRLFKKIIHKRIWNISHNDIIITDQFNRCVDDAFSYLHLHPDCKIISQREKKITIQLKNKSEITCTINNTFDIIGNDYAVSFGKLQSTQSIKINLQSVSAAVLDIKIKSLPQ